MLKNVQRAKFDKALVPIAKLALQEADREQVAFAPFFVQILMHELMHGLGPHQVRGPDGQLTSVRALLGDTYSALEEAKADVSGLFAMQKLLDDGKLEKALQPTLYPTYVASIFRSLRFGITEAHARGTALQLAWFLAAGGVVANADGTFAIDEPKLRKAVVSLTREIMTVQARGDRAAAAALLERGAVLPAPAKRLLARLAYVPVDLAPRFVTAELLTRRPAVLSAPRKPAASPADAKAAEPQPKP
jgi:hypothetical protein